MTDEDQLLTPPEAAAMVKFKASTLAVWRCEGTGPAYLRINRSIRYRTSDVKEWLNASPQVRMQLVSAAECHAEKHGKTKRLKGRDAVDERRRRLSEEPYCRDCREKGFSRLADQVDHIVPLADGGTDDDDNTRSLCLPCHQTRTQERFGKMDLSVPWYF